VQVVQVIDNQVLLELTLRGDAAQLSRALGLSRVLMPDPDGGATLAYRYAR
jgi:hypothetical protein